jgi:hypothetical protein
MQAISGPPFPTTSYVVCWSPRGAGFYTSTSSNRRWEKATPPSLNPFVRFGARHRWFQHFRFCQPSVDSAPCGGGRITGHAVAWDRLGKDPCLCGTSLTSDDVAMNMSVTYHCRTLVFSFDTHRLSLSSSFPFEGRGGRTIKFSSQKWETRPGFGEFVRLTLSDLCRASASFRLCLAAQSPTAMLRRSSKQNIIGVLVRITAVTIVFQMTDTASRS